MPLFILMERWCVIILTVVFITFSEWWWWLCIPDVVIILLMENLLPDSTDDMKDMMTEYGADAVMLMLMSARTMTFCRKEWREPLWSFSEEELWSGNCLSSFDDLLLYYDWACSGKFVHVFCWYEEKLRCHCCWYQYIVVIVDVCCYSLFDITNTELLLLLLALFRTMMW